MPRIAKFRTYFCKKNSGGGPPDDPTGPRPHFQYNFFFLSCAPPHTHTYTHFSAPSYATDIYRSIWMIPHIITLFEFIVPNENQHRTLNIKKFDRAKLARVSIYAYMSNCWTSKGETPLSLLLRGRFRNLPICFIFSSYRSIYDKKKVDKALFIFNLQ